jgi:hypothetical protein
VRDRPLFDAGVPKVGEIQRPTGRGLIQKRTSDHEGGDAGCQVKGVDAGILLPTILLGGWAAASDETQARRPQRQKDKKH